MTENPVEYQIGEQVATLMASFYGAASVEARTYVLDDFVAVVLEETFTHAEKGLIAAGKTKGIQEIRQEWQQLAKAQFVEIVEAATGKNVRAFMSNTDPHENLSVEIFILSEKSDMSGFDAEMNRLPDTPDEGTAAA